MGMAVFADEFIRAYGLSRTELATAYLFGTLASALLLTRAGRWYDRYGARVMLVIAPLGLAVMLVFLSMADGIAVRLSHWLPVMADWIVFVLLFIGYFGVRFAGQGVLTSASRNVLLVWFERRRGLVSGVRGVFVSLGFSLAPLLLAWLIDDHGWRAALWILAALVAGYGLVALVAIRDHPSQCGLEADGGGPGRGAAALASTLPDRTLAEARRDPVFWLYASALSMHALFGTAVTFHVVAIFGEAGRGREEAFAYFLPQAIVSTVVNLTASAAADRMRLKPLLVVMLLAFCAGAIGLINLASTWGYWLLVAGFGAGGGLWGVLSNLFFIRQFGALHLGEISGLNTALTVSASALGPLLFSLAFDFGGRFSLAAWACLCALIGLLSVSVVLRQPQDRVPGAG